MVKKIILTLSVIVFLFTTAYKQFYSLNAHLYGKTKKAAKKSSTYLFKIQKGSHWEGEIYVKDKEHPNDAGDTAISIIVRNFVGVDNEKKKKALEFLLKTQKPNGDWGSDYGNFAGLLALKTTDPVRYKVQIRKAQDFIGKNNQSLEKFEIPDMRGYYALYGLYPWEKITDIPSLSDISSSQKGDKYAFWKQTLAVDIGLGLLILKTLATKESLTEEEKVLLKKAEQKLKYGQFADGSWSAAMTETPFPAMALHQLDPQGNRREVKAATRFIESLQREEGRVQMYLIPTMDTALVIQALKVIGWNMNDRRIQKAVKWLKSVKYPLGGWGYGWSSAVTWDNDDTSFVLTALKDLHPDYTRRYVKLLLKRQNSDGGWSAGFGKTDVKYAKTVEPWRAAEPSVPDLTGHVLNALGRHGYTIENEQLQKTLYYLKRVQFADGKWFGYWGTCFIYGTGAVLSGLRDVKENMSKPYVRKAVKWLKKHQNEDGGWGETPKSFYDLSFAGKGKSTPAQTGQALIGLLAAGEKTNSSGIKRGIKYLINQQHSDGHWDEFPVMWANGVVYTDTLVDQVYPLQALGEYMKRVEKEAEPKNHLSFSILRYLAVFIILSFFVGWFVSFLRKRLKPARGR